MLDLLVTHATLPDGRTDMSLAVRDGRFVDVVAGPLQAPARQTLDAQGLLVSPPFVDAHFHMDATLSYGMPRVNQSGTLLEGIALWGELKPHLTQQAVVDRALAYCDWAVARGLLAIRSHVDTTGTPTLTRCAAICAPMTPAPRMATCLTRKWDMKFSKGRAQGVRTQVWVRPNGPIDARTSSFLPPSTGVIFSV